ncbi:MAG: beta-propeller fold lactonase family protein [candidate division WOR-3 bacterium]|nr:MAG: beta-propeller fold lactonase family protein [candidate division WOR-3 bacterium]
MRFALNLVLLPVLVLAQHVPTVSGTPVPPFEQRDVKGLTLADLLPACNLTDTTRTDIDPGLPPEGDYLGWMAYTRDGSKLLLTNRGTDNITVFDVATMQVDTNIPTGSYPGAIAVTDSLCIITLGFSDSIEVYRLSDWSRLARLPSGEQPWTIRLSPDDSLAFVSCDITNTCEVYDLTTLEHLRTITGFPVFLSTYSWNSENGRNSFTFSDFGVHPDGGHLIAPNGDDTVYVFDIEGGPPTDTLTGFGDCRNVRFSGDNSVAVIVDGASPVTALRLDLDSMRMNATVSIPDRSVGMDRSCGVNWDGTKAFISVSGNISAMLRFETGDYVTYSQTYSAFWIGVNPAHAIVISGQYRFTAIDFETEAIIGQHIGNSQSVGVTSPAANQAAGIDPHRHEGVYFYSFDSVAPPDYRGTTSSGLDPEGDCPHRLAIAPDGSKAVVANVLSDNITIIDLATNTIDTILEVGDRPQELALTSDSRWAAVAVTGSNWLKLIDLSDNSVAATVNTGSGPWPVVISQDDSFAYTGDISGNTVSVIRLDGAASHRVAQIPVGEIGVVWGNYGVASGLAISPDRNWLLVAGSFDDRVLVIDARNHTVVDTLAVGVFPLRFAFNRTGTHATVSNYLGNSFSVLRICGDSSYVVRTTSCSQYPLGVAYDPVDDRIGIGTYSGKTVVLIDPETGDVINTLSYSSYGSLSDVSFDQDGNVAAITQSANDIPGHLHRGDDHVRLPAVPKSFDYCPATRTAVVAMPGPDWVTVVQWPGSGAQEKTRIRPDLSKPWLRLSQNPASDQAVVRFFLPDPGPAVLEVFDITGRNVDRIPVNTATDHGSVAWHPAGLPAGAYLLRLATAWNQATTRVVVTD